MRGQGRDLRPKLMRRALHLQSQSPPLGAAVKSWDAAISEMAQSSSPERCQMARDRGLGTCGTGGGDGAGALGAAR